MSSRVRPPAAAGRFYPADPGVLRETVDRLLAQAPKTAVEGRVVGALCPHAGYDYSGPPTAQVFRALAGLAPEVVAVVGTAHFADRPGFFLPEHAALRTPLGEVPVAQEEAAQLLKSGDGVTVSAIAHASEHSVEVVLPFLQRTFQDFKLLPVVSNSQSLTETVRFGRALAGALKGKKALVIAASDLSHYPAWEVARQVDPASLESFLTLEPDYLWRTEAALMTLGGAELHCTWCGKAAAAAVQAAAGSLGADWGEALACTNSADRGGDEGRTVGYGAALLLCRGQRRSWPMEQVTAEEKTELLGLARASVRGSLGGQRHRPRLFDRPRFNLPAAVFVTWTKRDGNLRGCIGTTAARDTLGNAVARYAVCSAADDPRFPAVSVEELSGLRAEISILSAPRPARPEDIRPGLGVVVGRGARQGLFLPQVWEKLPDRDEFMAYLCEHKAGLPVDAWKQPGAELATFTVTAFSEPR
ncbi:MAG: AmmeMemoRadiSam system protein B [Elusimicrobia bacterium]|nr:AmmeMemoRadiSam system protein B [Elusimicrobiota bacterium]